MEDDTNNHQLQSISEFLKDLPVHNEENFSLYNVDNARTKRPS